MGNNGSSVNSTAVGVLVGFGILAILFTIGIVQFCCKYKCKKCKKCCKKKKPSLKEKVLKKVSTKKTPPPFTISSVTKWLLRDWQLLCRLHFPTRHRLEACALSSLLLYLMLMFPPKYGGGELPSHCNISLNLLSHALKRVSSSSWTLHLTQLNRRWKFKVVLKKGKVRALLPSSS